MNDNVINKKELLRELLIKKAQEQALTSNLSYGQQSLWFLNSTNKYEANYNSGFAIKITGKLNQEIFIRCLDDLVARHEVLRAVFKEINGIVKSVQTEKTIKPESIDATKIKDTELIKLVNQVHKKNFDLQNGPVFRPVLIKSGDSEHIFLFSVHHIVFDEWSSRIILHELLETYFARCEGNKVELPVLQKDYLSFVVHQKKAVENKDLQNFWSSYLEGHKDSVLELPGDNEYLIKNEMAQAGSILEFGIEETLLKDIYSLSHSGNITVFNVLLATLGLTLGKISGQNNFFLGTPVSGRTNSEFSNTVGYFVNMLPLRINIPVNTNFISYFKSQAEINNMAIANQDFPFNQMVEICNVERDIHSNPFFGIAFSYLNQKTLKNKFARNIDGETVEFSEFDIDTQESAFDITFEAREIANTLKFKIKFKQNKYSPLFIIQLFDYYIQTLRKAVDETELQVNDFKFNLKENKKSDCSRINDINTFENSVFARFEKQVQKHTRKPALQFGSDIITYGDLHRNVLKVANGLYAYTGSRNVPVGLIVEPSFSMIEGIFSILSLGCTYVPVSPDFPKSRLEHVIHDSGIQIVLTNKTYFKRVSELIKDKEILCIEDLLADNEPNKNVYQDIEKNQSDSIAYIMYTSGSTGVPKGVPIQQKSILNLVSNQNYIEILPEDNIPQLSSFVFDGSIFDIFGALLNGANLHFIDRQTILSGDKLIEYFNKNKVNKGFFTTALFNSLVDIDAENFLKPFDKILFGGELVSITHVKKAFATAKNNQVLLHVYGPTETTTFATYYPVNTIQETDKTIPIGTPINGNGVSIRDKQRQIVPKGMVGEIFINGIGLAKGGYIGSKINVQDSFLNHPEKDNELIYATGDYAFMNDEGNIIFIGRKDHQVKLRGFRIDLGEIDAAIQSTGKVSKSVTVLKPHNGNKQIISVVEAKSTDTKPENIISELTDKIPAYMIPARIIILEKMALNQNAKIDRDRIDSILNELLDKSRDKIRKPVTDIEKKVTGIWEEVLKVSNTGLDDNFFELGGHSLMAMGILSRIKQEFNVEISPVSLFNKPTISALCIEIEKNQKNSPSIKSIKRTNRNKYMIQ
jgi:amino acid adenylation domain-containing protein